MVHTVQFGAPLSLRHRFIFRDEDGSHLSPWHDLPLDDTQHGCLTAVCKTQRGSWAKWEVAEQENLNPLRLVEHRGVPSHFPQNCPWVISMLPQTWADPEEENEEYGGLPYDGRPLEVFDVSRGGAERRTGEVYGIKPITALGFVEDGLWLSWKLVGVAIDDELALMVNDSADLMRVLPDCIPAIWRWLCQCYTNNPDNLKPGQLSEDAAFVGGWEGLDLSGVSRVIEQHHASWNIFVSDCPNNGPRVPEAARQLLDARIYERLWARQTHRFADISIPFKAPETGQLSIGNTKGTVTSSLLLSSAKDQQSMSPTSVLLKSNESSAAASPARSDDGSISFRMASSAATSSANSTAAKSSATSAAATSSATSAAATSSVTSAAATSDATSANTSATSSNRRPFDLSLISDTSAATISEAASEAESEALTLRSRDGFSVGSIRGLDFAPSENSEGSDMTLAMGIPDVGSSHHHRVTLDRILSSDGSDGESKSDEDSSLTMGSEEGLESDAEEEEMLTAEEETEEEGAEEEAEEEMSDGEEEGSDADSAGTSEARQRSKVHVAARSSSQASGSSGSSSHMPRPVLQIEVPSSPPTPTSDDTNDNTPGRMSSVVNSPSQASKVSNEIVEAVQSSDRIEEDSSRPGTGGSSASNSSVVRRSPINGQLFEQMMAQWDSSSSRSSEQGSAAGVLHSLNMDSSYRKLSSSQASAGGTGCAPVVPPCGPSQFKGSMRDAAADLDGEKNEQGLPLVLPKEVDNDDNANVACLKLGFRRTYTSSSGSSSIVSRKSSSSPLRRALSPSALSARFSRRRGDPAAAANATDDTWRSARTTWQHEAGEDAPMFHQVVGSGRLIEGGPLRGSSKQLNLTLTVDDDNPQATWHEAPLSSTSGSNNQWAPALASLSSSKAHKRLHSFPAVTRTPASSRNSTRQEDDDDESSRKGGMLREGAVDQLQKSGEPVERNLSLPSGVGLEYAANVNVEPRFLNAVNEFHTEQGDSWSGEMQGSRRTISSAGSRSSNEAGSSERLPEARVGEGDSEGNFDRTAMSAAFETEQMLGNAVEMEQYEAGFEREQEHQHDAMAAADDAAHGHAAHLMRRQATHGKGRLRREKTLQQQWQQQQQWQPEQQPQEYMQQQPMYEPGSEDWTEELLPANDEAMGFHGSMEQERGEYGRQDSGEYGRQDSGEYGRQDSGVYGRQGSGVYGRMADMGGMPSYSSASDAEDNIPMALVIDDEEELEAVQGYDPNFQGSNEQVLFQIQEQGQFEGEIEDAGNGGEEYVVGNSGEEYAVGNTGEEHGVGNIEEGYGAGMQLMATHAPLMREMSVDADMQQQQQQLPWSESLGRVVGHSSSNAFTPDSVSDAASVGEVVGISPRRKANLSLQSKTSSQDLDNMSHNRRVSFSHVVHVRTIPRAPSIESPAPSEKDEKKAADASAVASVVSKQETTVKWKEALKERKVEKQAGALLRSSSTGGASKPEAGAKKLASLLLPKTAPQKVEIRRVSPKGTTGVKPISKSPSANGSSTGKAERKAGLSKRQEKATSSAAATGTLVREMSRSSSLSKSSTPPLSPPGASVQRVYSAQKSPKKAIVIPPSPKAAAAGRLEKDRSLVRQTSPLQSLGRQPSSIGGSASPRQASPLGARRVVVQQRSPLRPARGSAEASSPTAPVSRSLSLTSADYGAKRAVTASPTKRFVGHSMPPITLNTAEHTALLASVRRSVGQKKA